jgi:hypothetical protein
MYSSAVSSSGSDGSTSIDPTTERISPLAPRVRASVTSRSSTSLTLRAAPARARPLSHARLSASNVTEIAFFGIRIRYRINIRFWMVQRGGRARFLLEPLQAFRIRRKGRRQHLDRHVATQPWIARTVNLAHTAGPNRADNFVHAEAGAGHERHVSKIAPII